MESFDHNSGSKRKTAKRFQTVFTHHFRFHTEAMTLVLDFFLFNENRPLEKILDRPGGPLNSSIEEPHSNALSLYMKDMEKTQTNPPLAMIQFRYSKWKSLKENFEFWERRKKKRENQPKISRSVKIKFNNKNTMYITITAQKKLGVPIPQVRQVRRLSG